jgi:hypothetical protein
MKSISAKFLTSWAQEVLSKAKNHKRKLLLVIISIALIATIAAFYIHKMAQTRTYYIAYIGRYNTPAFDRLHELALQKYIEELNAKLTGVRLKLREYNIDNYAGDSSKFYQEISGKSDEVVAVIDNTWGKDFQRAVNLIRDHHIPVININADKSVADYGKNAVFLGHDDNVPGKIAAFCKEVLNIKKAIFIAEQDYALTNKFRAEFAGKFEISEIPVSTEKLDGNELVNLISRLKAKLDEQNDQSKGKPEERTVILNVHAEWGNEIIHHIETHYRNVVILGGSYIISGGKYDEAYGRFDHQNKGNSLIMLNAPSDAANRKSYIDLNDLKGTKDENPKVFEDSRSHLFVKRCLDAISLIQGALEKANNPTTISRKTFIDFFSQLAAQPHVSKEDELYIFDNNLLLSDERLFELRTKGQITSHPKQIDGLGRATSNIYFGVEIINVSNIDVDRRTFHADFFYWIKSGNDNPDIKYIFRNEKNPNSEQEIPIFTKEGEENTVYKLFKRSADFSMDVNFRKYPFDTQEIKIEVEVVDPTNKLPISFDNSDSDFEKRKKKIMEFNLDEWTMDDFFISVDNFITTSFRGSLILENQKPQKFKTLNVTMQISRNPPVPVVTIILPLAMIGIAAIAILFVEDTSFEHVGEVCIGIFLSIVTYSIGFAQLTPRTNVLTIADILFYGTFVVVLLIFLKVIFFSSNLISDSVRSWASRWASLIGGVALSVYCVLFAAIIIYGKM